MHLFFPLVTALLKQKAVHIQFHITVSFRAVYISADMSSGHSSQYEVKTESDSPLREQESRRPRKSGKHVREEPITLIELHASPLAMQCFEHQSCYEFCQKVIEVQFHHELARLFVLHLHGDQVTLAGVTFTLTPETVSLATGIPNISEPWHKKKQIDRQNYEPYIKPN